MAKGKHRNATPRAKGENGWERALTPNGRDSQKNGARLTLPPAAMKIAGILVGDIVTIDTGKGWLGREFRVIPPDAIIIVPKKSLQEEPDPLPAF